MKPRVKSYLVNLAVGLCFGILTFVLNSQGSDILVRRLCDSCFVPAVLLLGYGGLVFCRNQGTFDVMTYGVKSVFHTHVPGASIGHARDEKEDFLTYRDRKAASRKPPYGTLWVGLVLTALSIVLVVIYELV